PKCSTPRSPRSRRSCNLLSARKTSTRAAWWKCRWSWASCVLARHSARTLLLSCRSCSADTKPPSRCLAKRPSKSPSYKRTLPRSRAHTASSFSPFS
ncbi:hypothetical protein IWW57_002822, partial [Coemansia sp. S610]